mmetsp:Transcript_130397/g.237154  ORF Transcript_130397/g.237154 Transcript_130397/m.237154 type:complete len:414 (+) Transcript_130397:66-1307(+)
MDMSFPTANLGMLPASGWPPGNQQQELLSGMVMPPMPLMPPELYASLMAPPPFMVPSLLAPPLMPPTAPLLQAAALTGPMMVPSFPAVGCPSLMSAMASPLTAESGAFYEEGAAMARELDITAQKVQECEQEKKGANAALLQWLADEAQRDTDFCKALVRCLRERSATIAEWLPEDCVVDARGPQDAASTAGGSNEPPEGQSCASTLMLRNVPFDWTVDRLRQELMAAGIEEGTDIDCICLLQASGSEPGPVSASRNMNKGYAFINSTSPEAYARVETNLQGRSPSLGLPLFQVCAAKEHGVEYYKTQHPSDSMFFGDSKTPLNNMQLEAVSVLRNLQRKGVEKAAAEEQSRACSLAKHAVSSATSDSSLVAQDEASNGLGRDERLLQSLLQEDSAANAAPDLEKVLKQLTAS